jgi:putative membrane protein
MMNNEVELSSDLEDKEKEQDKDTEFAFASWKEAPLLALKGFLMGSADIIPGVSGGTMALIVGIYNRLIHAISSFGLEFIKLFFTLRWKRAFGETQWEFMLFLVSGIACAALFFTRVVPLQYYMFTNPELIYGLFFGLIIGSIIILIKEIDEFSWRTGLFIIAGVILGLYVVTRVPAETPTSLPFIFLSGALAICAMILPGISGSYILLIMRKYQYILAQLGKIGTADTLSALAVLVPFFLGALVGIMLFTRFLSWLLDRYYAQTLAVLIGFLIGSLYVIWPYQHRTYTSFVTKTHVAAVNSDIARHLRSKDINTNQPEYKRIGGTVQTGKEEQVKIETVQQKLVKSEPFVPYATVEGAGTDDFWQGIIGFICGVVLLGGLDYLREVNVE